MRTSHLHTTFEHIEICIVLHVDSVEVGIIFICAVLMLIIMLTATGWVFIRKNTTAKKGSPAMPSQTDPDSVNENAQTYRKSLYK